MPDVPTLAEAGVPGYEVEQWNGILAPHGTPKNIIDILNSEINKVVASTEVRKILTATGAEPGGGTPAELREFIKADIAKWAKVIKGAKLKAKK
jgi:tripartite-type tricarboxylate transporter receptor subunit TctC